MAENKKTLPQHEVKPKTLIFLFLTAVIMAGMYAYYMYNIWLTLAAAVLIGVVFYIYLKKPEYDAPQKDYSVIIKIIGFAAIVFMLVRFARILSLPGEFHGDEWSDIVEAAYKMNGDKGLMDNSGRNGAALPYFSQLLCALFLVIFRGNIEWLRTIPLLMITGGAIAVYCFGKEARNKNFGIILAFIYASSGWTLFTARQMLANVYDVFFLLLILALFYSYLNKGGLWKVITCGLILLAGLFTYAAWVIIVPYMGYLIYEYRKELKKEAIYSFAGFLGLFIILGIIIFLKFKGISTWATGQTVLKSGDMIGKLVSNIAQIPNFYALPLVESPWFTKKYPILSYTEFFMLLGGIGIMVSNLKDKLNRVVLVGFVLAHVTIVISTGLSHHMRHILLLPFVIIICGTFLARLLKWRYAYLFILLQALFFINTAFYMFYDWTNQLDIFTTDRTIASYINKQYSGADYLFMHQTVPYGDYPCFLRTMAAYNKTSPEKIKKVLFVVTSLYRGFVGTVFPGAKAKYFYDYDNAHKFTYVLFEVDVSANAGLKEYFMSLERILRSATVELWCLNYTKSAQICNSALVESGNDLYKIFSNTMFKSTLYEAYGRTSDGKDTIAAIFDKTKKSYVSPEWYVNFANHQLSLRNYDQAMTLFKQAYAMAPEWWELRQSINKMDAQLKEMNIR